MIKKYIPASVKTMVKMALYSGTKYECPICGFKAKELYPIGCDFPVLKEMQIIGAGPRAGGCYKCNSSDRERLVYTYLRDKLKVWDKKQMSILHLAPEKNISRLLSETGFDNYVCGDLFTEGYDYPDYVQNMNVLDIPFEDNSFDLIICNHLLEHVPTDAAAMAELYRVLRPEGQAILQVPISPILENTYEDLSIVDPAEREKAFGQFDHVRIYGQDYPGKLEAAGFTVRKQNISAEYPKYGLSLQEDLYLATKAAD